MPMTRDQQLELRKMLQGCHGAYSIAKREALKTVPVTSSERAALRLLKQIEGRRERARQRVNKRYEIAKSKARELVFLGDDAKKALKAIKSLQAMS